MNNFKNIILCITVIGLFSASCSKKLDQLLVNPNNPSPTSADVDLYLNQAQIAFKDFYNTCSDYGAQLTRSQVMFGPLYTNAYQPQTFDGIWTTAYSTIMNNINAMLPLAESPDKNLLKHAAIAKILKAYVLITLVDDFGDVPNSEAEQGIENTNPNADAGAAVYESALALLDEAIANLNDPANAGTPTNDLFYAGNASAWIKVANTLKFKAYLQTRLVDGSVASKIDALIADGNLIDADDGSEDFVFKFSTNQDAPDTRHPHYASNYTPTGAGDYIGTYMLWSIVYEKNGNPNLDPRRRYYFYRQRTNYGDANSSSCPCAYYTRPAFYPDEMAFCLPSFTVNSDGSVSGIGYWGRDHGDNSGIPPDGTYRTAWGIYPAGGKFDASESVSANLGDGSKGSGIHPIWLASFTDFALAEAALTLGTTGDPRALLEKGVRASISKVMNFPASIGASPNPSYVPTQTTVDAYVAFVLSQYDAAATTGDKLNVIIKEYYLAAWGNGVEPYNNYRRTGKPDNLQLIVNSGTPGYFIRSFYYPSVYVNRNINAPAQKDNLKANKVFWDNNPDDFVK